MIYESYHWKKGLLRDAATLSKSRVQARSAHRTFIVEETVFIAAFKIRRLIESEKISSNLTSKSIPAIFYQYNGQTFDLNRRFNIDSFYHMEKGDRVDIGIKFMVNSIIHSFVFSETLRRKITRKKQRKKDRNYYKFTEIDGFVFNSERDRKKGIWQVDIQDYIDILTLFGNDNPDKFVRIWNEEKGEWTTWIGSGQPPREVLGKVKSRLLPSADN